jgi:hypothetical protein
MRPTPNLETATAKPLIACQDQSIKLVHSNDEIEWQWWL